MKNNFNFTLKDVNIKHEGVDFNVGEISISSEHEINASELSTIYKGLPGFIRKIYDVIVDLIQYANQQ